MIALTSATTALNYTILNDCTATQICIELLHCLVAGLLCMTATHMAVSTALDYRTLHCMTTLLLPHLDSPPDMSRLRYIYYNWVAGPSSTQTIRYKPCLRWPSTLTLYSSCCLHTPNPAHINACCIWLQFVINTITNVQCLHAGVLTSRQPPQCLHWQSYGWAYCRCNCWHLQSWLGCCSTMCEDHFDLTYMCMQYCADALL